MVNDQSHYIPIKRSIQWITKGESADFLNPRKLEVVKRQGDQRTLAFDQQMHADDIAYNASQATHLCVVQDLDLYTFSISLEMADLQRHLSGRLRSYPIYENELKKILTRLYAKDSQVVQHIDQELRHFIADRIKCFHRTLIADNSFPEVLRTCISPQDELHSLLRHKYVDDLTLEKALQVVRPAVNAPDWAETLLQDFDRMHLNASVTTPPDNQPISPTSDPRRSSHVSNDGSQTPDEAGHILRAIYRDKRIVKAARGCTGTLLSSGRPGSESPKVPNNEFQVKRHQILVELPDRRPRFGGRNVRVYMSYEGRIGEMYENLKLTPIQDETLPALPSPSTQGAKRNRPY